MNIRLPAEWEPQDGIILPWPHPATDWNESLHQAEPVFLEIACKASLFERVIVISPDATGLPGKLADAGTRMDNIVLIEIDTNDTWARDFGPITVYKSGTPCPLNFRFNGWGGKFDSSLDNQVTNELDKKRLFSQSVLTVDMVLEGGSIDSDGRGNLLTTMRCLLNRNRNPEMSQEDIEQALKRELGAENILWLNSGALQGDDTDSHIDILARFAPDDTILYVRCDDESDPHHDDLTRMHTELAQFRTGDSKPFNLKPLPMPTAKHDNAGNRLAATYANFLVINDAVLVPTYNDPQDDKACQQISAAFPEREIIGIDCTHLIRQGGSLHCLTMQLPEGVLR